jgi:hypothetical protein
MIQTAVIAYYNQFETAQQPTAVAEPGPEAAGGEAATAEIAPPLAEEVTAGEPGDTAPPSDDPPATRTSEE